MSLHPRGPAWQLPAGMMPRPQWGQQDPAQPSLSGPHLPVLLSPSQSSVGDSPQISLCPGGQRADWVGLLGYSLCLSRSDAFSILKICFSPDQSFGT